MKFSINSSMQSAFIAHRFDILTNIVRIRKEILYTYPKLIRQAM
jgi:hypothetical protein